MGNTASVHHAEPGGEAKGAGCLFTDGIHVLAGYQIKKGQPILSGLGGAREGDEILPVTAFRETLEELLGLYKIPFSVLFELYVHHKPSRCIIQGSYSTYVLSFTQLESILKSLHAQNFQSSPFYKEFPLTLQDLLFKRLPNQSEVSVLALLPAKACSIAPEFLHDLQRLA